MSCGATCGGIDFHPDGILLGVGTGISNGAGSCEISIFDVRTGAKATSLIGHSDLVTALSFSENGYLLASGGTDGMMCIWDLRGATKVVHSMSMQSDPSASVLDVKFDYSGKYVSWCQGRGVAITAVKEWNERMSSAVHSKIVTAVGWGADASFVATSSMDKTVRMYRNA